MDRISDGDLDSLIKKWADPVQALEEGLLELPALVELRERRLKDGMLEAINRKLYADLAMKAATGRENNGTAA